MSKARLHIETLAAFSTPTVKPSLRPGSLSLQQVKKLPTAPQRKHNGGMHTHTHTYTNTQLKTDLPQDMLTALAAASLTDCQQCYTQERVCVREKRDGERESYTGWGGKKLEGENEGRKRPKEKARGCLWGQKEEKKTQWKPKMERVEKKMRGTDGDGRLAWKPVS